MKKKKIFFDGAMGTSLAARGKDSSPVSNLKNPLVVKKIHKEFIQAGADIIETNTFAANPLNYQKDYKKLIKSGVKLARQALSETGAKKIKIAGSIGPTGKMVKPVGSLDFEDAVKLFKDTAEVFAGAGVEILIIETMDDISEMRAALIGAKEANEDLEIYATMTFSEGQRTSTGTPAESAVAAMDALGADVVGVNCSFGPEGLVEVVKKMRRFTSKPIMAQPNAGLPDPSKGTMVYPEKPSEYAVKCRKLIEAGVSVIGGCCGTTPEHIVKLKKEIENTPFPSPPEKIPLVITSRTDFVPIGEFPVIIGERINFTARPQLATSTAKVVAEGLKQKKAGAAALDINLADREEHTLDTVLKVEERTSLPVVLDSQNAREVEKAARRYPGLLLLNSIPEEKEKMSSLFPVVKKYGLPFIALCVSDSGVAGSIKGKIEVARRLIDRAAKEGVAREKILIDPVVLAVSSSPSSAYKTLKAINKLKLPTVLGISNVSSGLPQRALLNQTFSALAVYSGASAVIADPLDTDLLYSFYSSALLSGRDPDARNYTAYFSPVSERFSFDSRLSEAIFEGRREFACQQAGEALENSPPLEVIEKRIAPALERVGIEYGKKNLFLPQLIQAARSAEAAIGEVEKVLKSRGSQRKTKGTILIATVKGDIHDIGKNLVSLLLKNSSFKVIDLGVDADSDEIISRALEAEADIIALSALMTTTMDRMKEVKVKIDSKKVKMPLLVGGAAVTEKFAQSIGAVYAADAVKAVKAAEKLMAR